MLTAARLREYTGPSAALDLLRDLGYPVAPVEVDPLEWRRGGVTVPWNGASRFTLAARLRNFDLFTLSGTVSETDVAEFLRSYAAYNLCTKSVVLYEGDKQKSISIFDLSSHRALRRLDVDLASPSAHAVDRLNLLARGSDAAMPRIFDRALDRENVTREFFQRFRGAVREVAGALAAAFPDEEKKSVDGEALLILSRLLFLSFIQEKGWLNGERRFLVDRLDREVRAGREFFSGVLLPLFFGCLNTTRRERTFSSRRLGRIPYLNGGLFEPAAFEVRHPEMHLPNELMRGVLEGVFERFDFRADEKDSAGTHVDPEMLGKVFESLMAADERAASGSFYTPKEIVDSLAERAIREWVGNEPTIEKLSKITVLDPACGSGAFLLSALGIIEKMWKSCGEAPRDLRRQIVARSLFGVDVKQEAVRLCELRLWLAIVSASDAAIEEVEPLPNLDRNILQGNSLLSPTDFLGTARTDVYGEWLVALRAQRDLIDRYRSAPHGQRPALYRLIRGHDQRLAAELLGRCVDAAEEELRVASSPQRDLFGRAIPLDERLCGELHRRVTEARRMLEKVEEGDLDFFSFDVHFAHVLAAGGFSVVLGNPPWVRHSRIERDARRMLADRYELFRASGERTAFHQPDLSVAFFDRALALTAPDGIAALLVPSKLVNAAYAAPLRKAVLSRVISLDDWSDDPRRRRWFDADTFPLAMVVRRERVDGSQAVRVTAAGESFACARVSLPVAGPSSEWALVPPDAARVLRRLREAHGPLEEQLGRKPVMGVKTGSNDSFFLDVQSVRDRHLLTADGVHVPLDCVCRVVRGRDLQRWRTLRSQWMLWPPGGGWSGPPRWLENHAQCRGVDASSFRLAFVRPEHVGIKVAWKDLSRGMCAAVLSDSAQIDGRAFPLVPNQTLYLVDAVSLDEAYVIAAVLNSTVVDALLLSVAERAKDAHYRYFGRTVAALPWPDMRIERQTLVRLSRRAHRGIDVAEELDAVVAEMYGVTERELRFLRAFVARRLRAG